MKAPIEQRTFCGPKPKPRKSTATVPPETILLIRKLRGWSGWQPKDIAEVTQLTPAYISQVCAWTLRADIDPGRAPAPFSKPWIDWHEQLTQLHTETTE